MTASAANDNIGEVVYLRPGLQMLARRLNNKWPRVMKVLQYAAGWALAIVWLRSSAAHLANPYSFLSAIYQYELVGPSTGMVIAMLLPALQVILATSLVARLYPAGSLMLTTVLLGVFWVVQASAALRGLSIDCGCFGASLNTPVGARSISSVMALFILALCSLIWELVSRKLD